MISKFFKGARMSIRFGDKQAEYVTNAPIVYEEEISETAFLNYTEQLKVYFSIDVTKNIDVKYRVNEQ